MAQELETKSTDSKVFVDKSLINNKFETYKLSFDYIINSVKKPVEQKQSVDSCAISKRKQLSNQHQHILIQLKNRLSNVSQLENIIKRNYLFMINGTPFYYDTTGIFIVNETTFSIHQIYQFSNDIDVSNLSVTGFYDKQSADYFVIFSHSNNKISLLKLDSFTKASTLFNDEMKDINSGFIIQNGYYSKQLDKIFCSVLSWQRNTENNSFNPLIHLISFNINSDNKQSTASYSICCEFNGAKKYFNCFFDERKETFWMISNGKFRRKDTMESKDKNNEIIDGNAYGSDWAVIQCFDISLMEIIDTIDFDDCIAWKVMSINCVSKEKDESGDRVLCVIGCELSHDMVVFNLLDRNDNNGYLLKHKATFPGLALIAKSRKNKKEILINAETQNVFIVQHKQYISSFVNPKCNNIGIQDSLQLQYNESYVGTKIIRNKLYCLTNSNFYIFHLPHING